MKKEKKITTGEISPLNVMLDIGLLLVSAGLAYWMIRFIQTAGFTL